MTLARRFINGRQQILLKKNLVDFFLKTHTSYLQLSFLSYAKILFEHGCFDKQTDPLVKVPFFCMSPKTWGGATGTHMMEVLRVHTKHA